MSDLFEAIAKPQHRKIVEALVAHPASTEEQIVALTKLPVAEVRTALKHMHKASMLTARGTAKATKFSVSVAALNKISAWVTKVAGKPKTEFETKLEFQIENVADKLGDWLATNGSKLKAKIAENTDIKNSDDLGREIGRLLAEVKKQADDSVGTDVRDVLEDVKKRIKRKK